MEKFYNDELVRLFHLLMSFLLIISETNKNTQKSECRKCVKGSTRDPVESHYKWLKQTAICWPCDLDLWPFDPITREVGNFPIMRPPRGGLCNKSYTYFHQVGLKTHNTQVTNKPKAWTRCISDACRWSNGSIYASTRHRELLCEQYCVLEEASQSAIEGLG